VSRRRRQGEETVRESARIVDAFLEEAVEGERVDFEVLLTAGAEAPSPSLKARLLDTLRVTHRFDDLEAQVAELADVSRERASALLLEVDSPEVWERGPRPGIDIFHFVGGEKVRDAVTGFVRLAPGLGFPEHEHVGDESVLVMSGALEDSSGDVYGAGERVEMAGGSHHSFRAVGPGRLLLLTVVQGGVIVDGELIPPGDPRA
jgi:hypothetical protein